MAGLFFPNARGSRRRANVIGDGFKKALRNSGIPYRERGFDPRSHDLRHALALRSMRKIRKNRESGLVAPPYLSVRLGRCGMSITRRHLRLASGALSEIAEKRRDCPWRHRTHMGNPKMKPADFSEYLTEYLRRRLSRLKNAGGNTPVAYSGTFRCFLTCCRDAESMKTKNAGRHPSSGACRGTLRRMKTN